jgi:hypothetical protein
VINTPYRKPFLIDAPKLLLGSNYAISEEEWQWIRARNLRQYYRRLNPDNEHADSDLPYTP